jgi:hypothetical protein
MFRRFLIARNIDRYGAEPILAWIKSLPLKEPTPYLCLVTDVAAAMAVRNMEPPEKKKARLQRALRAKLRQHGAEPAF